MKYDYEVKRMPGFGYLDSPDRDAKNERIWKVVMIESDDMGAHVKDIQLRKANLTFDEAASACDELIKEIKRAKREKQSNQSSN
jgi:hypothetical protein